MNYFVHIWGISGFNSKLVFTWRRHSCESQYIANVLHNVFNIFLKIFILMSSVDKPHFPSQNVRLFSVIFIHVSFIGNRLTYLTCTALVTKMICISSSWTSISINISNLTMSKICILKWESLNNVLIFPRILQITNKK